MSFTLRDGSEVDDPRLGRLPSVDDEHILLYPLTSTTLPTKPTAMVMGVNWYSNADRPALRTINGKMRWVIGEGPVGKLRGGHATCLRHWNIRDLDSWWSYYDQGVEGRCVEFACLRAMTLHNRKRYDITSRWHYHEMQESDEWQGCFLGHNGPAYDGTSVNAGLNVMRLKGPIPRRPLGRAVALEDGPKYVKHADGIEAFRWATSWDMVREALGVPDWLPGVPMLNSWGKDGYPHEVLVLDDFGARLLREEGEFGMITDR